MPTPDTRRLAISTADHLCGTIFTAFFESFLFAYSYITPPGQGFLPRETAIHHQVRTANSSSLYKVYVPVVTQEGPVVAVLSRAIQPHSAWCYAGAHS